MNIRQVYLYLFALIGLLLIVVGSAQLVDLAIIALVFPEADLYENNFRYPILEGKESTALSEEDKAALEEKQNALGKREQSRSRQRQFAGAMSMLLVGAPLYFYHWGIIKREKESSSGKAKNEA